MPLLKIFTEKALSVSANTLHKRLTTIWKVPEDVLKVLVVPTFDASGKGDGTENAVFIDVRAKAKPERTNDVIDEAMISTQKLLMEHGYKATIRVELYEPSLQSARKSLRRQLNALENRHTNSKHRGGQIAKVDRDK